MIKHDTFEGLIAYLIAQPSDQKGVGLSLVDWYKEVRRDTDHVVSGNLRAMLGGFYAHSAGQAFVFGYETAIQQLTGFNTQQQLAAFCVTEQKSAHPQAMQTILSTTQAGQLTLSGTKDFVTMAGRQGDDTLSGSEKGATCLLVAAKSGVTDDGRNQIKLVRVDVASSGVSMQPHPPLPFIPDVAHGTVTFDAVRVSHEEVYQGDGYAEYVKPFRWFEDINVFASIAGYLLNISLVSHWPQSAKVELISILSVLTQLQKMDADDPVAHIMMYNQASAMNCWLERYEEAWSLVEASLAADWKRDQRILDIANTARVLRFKKALTRLSLN